MSGLTEELRRLREENPDVAQILEVFEANEQVYRDSLQAMGLIGEVPQATGSTQVTISFDSTPSINLEGS